MRTATFATDEVVDLLNEKFVLFWHNQSPEWTSETGGLSQPTFTAEQLAQYPEGGGQGNVRTFVVRPDGMIAHYIEGYWSAPRFVDEVEYSLDPDAGHVDRHRAEIEELKKEDPNWKNVVESRVGRRIAAIELQIGMHSLSLAYQGTELAPALADIERQNSRRGVIS